MIYNIKVCIAYRYSGSPINILVLDTHIPNDFITIKINQDSYVGIQR
jgi:hypothetical protein